MINDAVNFHENPMDISEKLIIILMTNGDSVTSRDDSWGQSCRNAMSKWTRLQLPTSIWKIAGSVVSFSDPHVLFAPMITSAWSHHLHDESSSNTHHSSIIRHKWGITHTDYSLGTSLLNFEKGKTACLTVRDKNTIFHLILQVICCCIRRRKENDTAITRENRMAILSSLEDFPLFSPICSILSRGNFSSSLAHQSLIRFKSRVSN